VRTFVTCTVQTCWSTPLLARGSALVSWGCVAAVVAAIVPVAGVAYYHLSGSEASVHRDMGRAFDDGSGLEWAQYCNDNALIPRVELEGVLRGVLAPQRKMDKYIIVVGEKGKGKATAVRQAARAVSVPRGIVYMEAPAKHTEFTAVFATATRFRRHIDAFDVVRSRGEHKATDDATLGMILSTLNDVAMKFMAERHKPLVIIVDAVDRIAKYDEVGLRELQDWAKTGSDKGLWRVVFVTSDGSALPIFQSASAMSRAKVIDVDDVNDGDAIKWLVEEGRVPTQLQRKPWRP
jgi:hypothetical protein